MKLIIEETVGDSKSIFNMEGDYEEILALVTELGFCKDTTINNPTINIVNTSTPNKEQIISEFVRSKCYNCKHE